MGPVYRQGQIVRETVLDRSYKGCIWNIYLNMMDLLYPLDKRLIQIYTWNLNITNNLSYKKK